MYEFDHPDRIDQEFFQRARRAGQEVSGRRLVPRDRTQDRGRRDDRGPLDVPPRLRGDGPALIQKTDPVPAEGYTLNIESNRRDTYGNEGIFEPEEIKSIIEELERYHALPNAGYVFNNSFSQCDQRPDRHRPPLRDGRLRHGPRRPGHPLLLRLGPRPRRPLGIPEACPRRHRQPPALKASRIEVRRRALVPPGGNHDE